MRYLSFVFAHARFLGFGFLLAFTSTFGQTFYIAMYGGEVRAAFALSHGEFGTVYAIGTLASGVLIIWAGRVIDRVDLRHYTLVLCALIAVACLAFSLAGGVVLLVLAIFLLRIAGQGLLSQAATVTMARYFPQNRRGRAVSIAALGFPTGQAVFPPAAVLLLALADWRTVWLASAAAVILLVPPLALWLLRGHDRRHARLLHRIRRFEGSGEKSPGQWTRRQVIRDPRFLLAMPAMLAPSFIITGLNFHQVHLAETKGWALSLYASGFAIYAVCQVITSVLVGLLVDRFGSRRLTHVYLLPLAAASLVIAVFDSPLAIIPFMALAGMTGGAGATLLATVWAELYGVLNLGSIRALVAGLSVISSSLAPAVFGWLIDATVSIEAIAATCSLYAIAGAVLLTLVLQRNRMARTV